jgi:hypothetical protein
VIQGNTRKSFMARNYSINYEFAEPPRPRKVLPKVGKGATRGLQPVGEGTEVDSSVVRLAAVGCTEC